MNGCFTKKNLLDQKFSKIGYIVMSMTILNNIFGASYIVWNRKVTEPSNSIAINRVYNNTESIRKLTNWGSPAATLSICFL